MRHLIKIMGDKDAYHTAMTGIAALAVGGTTLHKYSGCGLAKEEARALLGRMSIPSKQRWKSTRLLFIDEVSMMDAGLFDKFDALARTLRGNPSALWGGIQLVMIGDFFQLPPISKASWGGDVVPARMLFESEAFRSQDVAKIKLTKVFR